MSESQFEQFRQIQERLSGQVRIEPIPEDPDLVAAVDLHIRRDSDDGVGAAVLFDRDGNLIDQHHVWAKIDIPYVPGFLSFREMPLCRDALRGLSQRPDVILVDGQGLAHPRRFGLACHLGVELDIPSIGVAKSRLAGRGSEPDNERGSTSPLMLNGDLVGMIVRTRTGVRPLYVSPGHRVTVEQAVELTLRYSSKYRLPDPSRAAHNFAREVAATT